MPIKWKMRVTQRRRIQSASFSIRTLREIPKPYPTRAEQIKIVHKPRRIVVAAIAKNVPAIRYLIVFLDAVPVKWSVLQRIVKNVISVKINTLYRGTANAKRAGFLHPAQRRLKIVSIVRIIVWKRMRMIRQSASVTLWAQMLQKMKVGIAMRVLPGQHGFEIKRWPAFLAKRTTFRRIVKNVINVRINILCRVIMIVSHVGGIRTERRRWKIASIV